MNKATEAPGRARHEASSPRKVGARRPRSGACRGAGADLTSSVVPTGSPTAWSPSASVRRDPGAARVERSVEMSVDMLGILKACGACLPLDPEHRAERLRWPVTDAGAPVVVAMAAFAPSASGPGARIVPLDAGAEATARQPEEAPASRARADNLACVICTSGLTGEPKGTPLSHRAILRLGIDADHCLFSLSFR